MFKVDFIKNDGKFKYIEYAVGDSAAEVTLIDEELADLLGATGPVINLETTWTDGTKREEKSKIVSITIRSRHTNKYITLEKCYTTRNLELPPRSLDMDELKKKYPYLKNVEFDSYFDVQPSMLIGTYHASLIENQRKLISKGIGFPVAINARIGISVYGGNTDSAVRTHINGCIVRKDKLISIENSNKSLPTNKSTHEKTKSIEIMLEKSKQNSNELKTASADATINKINNLSSKRKATEHENANNLTTHSLKKLKHGLPEILSIPVKSDRSTFKKGRILTENKLRKFIEKYLTRKVKWNKNAQVSTKKHITRKVKSKHLPKKNEQAKKFKGFPKAANIINNLTYMNDISSSSARNIDEAIEISKHKTHKFANRNWKFASIKCNYSEVLKRLPETHIKPEILPLLESENPNGTAKLSGSSWKNHQTTCWTELQNKKTKKRHKISWNRTLRRRRLKNYSKKMPHSEVSSYHQHNLLNL